MSYTPGHYVDLTHLNKRKAPPTQKKSTSTGKHWLEEAGTRFILKFTNGEYKAFRRIEISMA